MSTRQILKKFFLPGAVVVGVNNGHSLCPHCSKNTECSCKPSDLPLYPFECGSCNSARPVEKLPSDLETAIGKVRKELWVWQDELKGYRQRFVDFAETGVAHSSSTIDFLREESNGPERAGAIGVAAVSGFVLGLRGGLIKRLTYTTLGGLSMAALCYPRTAAEYTDLALQGGNQYFVAGYHFLFGDTPKIPQWLESVLGLKKEETNGNAKEK